MHQRSPAAAPSLSHRAGVTHGRSWRDHTTTFSCLPCSCMALLAAAAGCGGEAPDARPEEVRVTERALQSALGGKKPEFVSLVAPSFLAQARAEMSRDGRQDPGWGCSSPVSSRTSPSAGRVESQYSISESPPAAPAGLRLGPFRRCRRQRDGHRGSGCREDPHRLRGRPTLYRPPRSVS